MWAGAFAGAVALWVFDLSWLGLLLVVAAVVAFEAFVAYLARRSARATSRGRVDA
jgi:hypothetical protein